MGSGMVLQPWGCLLILHLGAQATDSADAGHWGSSMPSEHIPEQRRCVLDVLAVLQLHTTHCPTTSLPACCTAVIHLFNFSPTM